MRRLLYIIALVIGLSGCATQTKQPAEYNDVGIASAQQNEIDITDYESSGIEQARARVRAWALNIARAVMEVLRWIIK